MLLAWRSLLQVSGTIQSLDLEAYDYVRAWKAFAGCESLLKV